MQRIFRMSDANDTNDLRRRYEAIYGGLTPQQATIERRARLLRYVRFCVVSDSNRSKDSAREIVLDSSRPDRDKLVQLHNGREYWRWRERTYMKALDRIFEIRTMMEDPENTVELNWEPSEIEDAADTYLTAARTSQRTHEVISALMQEFDLTFDRVLRPAST